MMDPRKSLPQDFGTDLGPPTFGPDGDRLAKGRTAMYASGEPRILLACITVSFLLHIWLMAGIERNDGGSWRESLPVLTDVRIESGSGAADGQSLHQVPSAPEPTRAANGQPRSEVAGLRPHRSTSEHTSINTMQPRVQAAATEGSRSNIDTKDDDSHSVLASRSGSDLASTAPSARQDRPIIATAAQYRLALILAARRERERVEFLGLGEGRARVRLDFGSGGTLHTAQVVASSGHEALDAEALRLFGRAHQSLPVPSALLANPFSIEATVSFERE